MRSIKVVSSHRWVSYFPVLLLSLLTSGCAQMFPARSAQLEPNVHRVWASGNTFATPDTLQEKVDKKSVKLCGAGAYTYAGVGDFEVKKERAYINGAMQENYYLQLTRVVRCRGE